MSTDFEKATSAALTPDHHSKTAYTGRIKQTETVQIVTDEGITLEKEVSFFISWDSIASILKLVRERIGLK